jgi:uncharacterized phage protein gp47/JayE
MQIPDELDKRVEDIKTFLLSNISDEYDKTQGSFVWDILSAVAIEQGEIYIQLQEILKRAFVQSSYGEYLDLLGQHFGIERNKATKATGYLKVQGIEGTIIPAGARFSTIGDDYTSPIEFETLEEVVIGSSGDAVVSIRAIDAGKNGNVPAKAITLPSQYISGLSAVYNETPTSGGTDDEDDDAYRNRILNSIQKIRTGGNINDYISWAMEVDGVGKVQIIPNKFGNGTVGVLIIDSNYDLPSPTLIDEVQNYIQPRLKYRKEAENFVISGYGVSIVDLDDDNVQSIKMIYNSQGNGKISLPLDFLENKGVWGAKIRIKVNDNTINTNLLKISFVDIDGNIAKRSPFGVDAVYIYRASDLNSYFDYVDISFYNDKVYSLIIERLAEDTTTEVYIDFVDVYSKFGVATETAKAPIGASVYVEAPEAVNINVSCRFVLKSGVNIEDIKQKAIERIKQYFKEIALEGVEVSYQYIGALLIGISGVYDVRDLRLNGGVGNIEINKYQIPVLNNLEVTT